VEGGGVDWKRFAVGYRKSLKGKEDLLRALARVSKKETITLLCTEKDPSTCHRSLLKKEIERYL
jgi:uncharacterized protein YeaO (DUF488 family)